MPDGVKRCPKCGEVKGLSAFGRESHRPSGIACWCKRCRGEQAQRWRSCNQEKERKRQREYHRGYRKRHGPGLRKNAHQIIMQRTGLPYRLVPADLLEAEIAHLKVSRLCAELKKGNDQ